MARLLRFWNRIRRGAFYALLLILFALLQDVVLCNIAPFGVKAMFMPALVVAVGFFEGGWRGGAFGVAAGMIADLSGSDPRVLFTVVYPLLGFAMGFVVEFFLNRKLYVYCVGAAAALFLCALLQMFPLLAAAESGRFALWKTCILQSLWSLPFLFPAYYSCEAAPRVLL